MVKVLLTGGSGFIAAHIIDNLLEHGFDTVVTVRSDEKGQRILDAHSTIPKEKLSYVIVKDVAQDGAFDEAVKSAPFDYVLHTASPFHMNVQDPIKDFLDPAIKGTTGILKAIKAYAPSVKRVVVTSSFAAIQNSKVHPKLYNESVWNPVTWDEAVNNPAVTYLASKTFAEKAAWDFVEKEKPSFDLVTLCPPMVYGPIVHYLNSMDAINTSNARFRDLIQGKMKEELAPTGVIIWVDVRDLSLAHVRAIEVPEAGGQRFFLTAGHYNNKQIAELVRETHPELNSKLPPKELEGDFPNPESVYDIDNTKSKEVLGIKYRSLRETVSDTVDSLLAAGA